MGRPGMRGGRAALLLSLCAGLLAGTWAAPAQAAPAPRARPGEAFLFLVDRVSFEELMAVPEFRQLARSGGAALMTTHVGAGDRESSSYLTILNGTATRLMGPRSLLVRVLDARGVPPVTGDDSDLLALSQNPGPTSAVIAELRGTRLVDEQAPSSLPAQTEVIRGHSLRLAGRLIRDAVRRSTAQRVLVIVATPQPSFEMDGVGDEVTPLVMAEGTPRTLFRANGPLHTLTSASTRQKGLVSNVDVAPTVLSFFGVPVPSEMDGQPITPVDAVAPFALHDRELEQRRTRVPIQMGELGFVGILFGFAWVAMLRAGVRGGLSHRTRRVGRFLLLAGAALPIALLAGGLLPRFTYAWEVPFLVLATAGLAWLAARTRLPGPLAPFVFLGLAGLALLVVDGAVGGRAFRMPLLGGTMFDGVRFYGLPNSMFMVPLASALFVAHPLPTRAGLALLVGVALFAGFPALGADVGGAISLFVATGLWWGLRARGRFGVRELAVTAGVAILGLAVVLAASRLFPGAPTHAARFVERTGGRVGSALSEARHRLGIGVHQLLGHPAAFIPILGLPAVAALALRPPGPIRAGLDLDPAWRHVLIVMSLAGLVAFFVNDTGVAAAAPVFLPAGCALLYPALLAGRAAPAGSGRAEGRAGR